jgi:adenylylsulfate kinase
MGRLGEILDSNLNAKNLFCQKGSVSRERREALNSHKGFILWFTGLPCAGKSTLAHFVEEKLNSLGCRTMVLDGDNVRHGLCSDLAFSNKDRTENIRRIGEISRLFIEAGIITLTAFISPIEADRERARNLVAKEDFIEIYCRCSLEICEQRDVKGLYQLARAGKTEHFTGISSPYEPPLNPELIIDTEQTSVEDSGRAILEFLSEKKIIQLSDPEHLKS